MPVIGFHSVIDRPDSVSRTAPPTITMRKTSTATVQSQTRTARASSRTAECGPDSTVAKVRRSVTGKRLRLAGLQT
jgi:hypothetical protein